MSSNTTTSTSDALPTSTPADTPTTTVPSSSPANSTPTTASTPQETTTPPTSLPTSEPPTTSIPDTSTTSSEVPPTTSTTSTTSSESSSTSSTPEATTIISSVIVTPSGGGTSTLVTTVTSFQEATHSSTTSSATSSSTTGAGAITPGDNSHNGLSTGGRIAVAVVVPIAAVALLVLAGIYFWRKRKQRKDAEEQRRKEVEDYTYNPNADPTIPAVGAAGTGAYEMKEDASSGYRGWGSTTLAGSTGRKASTTMSGGAGGTAYSDATSPTRGNISDTRSGEPLMNDGPQTPEGEILGAMGPSASATRGSNVHRGPSNASSSYSAAARSDGSGGDVGVAYGDPQYYDQYGSSNPYTENGGNYGSPPQRPSELGGQPVIRDNPARRNTRIENPAHYPQQSAGISQNF